MEAEGAKISLGLRPDATAVESDHYSSQASQIHWSSHGTMVSALSANSPGESPSQPRYTKSQDRGMISAAQGAVQNRTGLVMARFFLGFVEAPFFCGAIMMMSSWYTRQELAHRIAWFYSGTSLANAFGGLIGAGVLGNCKRLRIPATYGQGCS